MQTCRPRPKDTDPPCWQKDSPANVVAYSLCCVTVQDLGAYMCEVREKQEAKRQATAAAGREREVSGVV